MGRMGNLRPLLSASVGKQSPIMPADRFRERHLLRHLTIGRNDEARQMFEAILGCCKAFGLLTEDVHRESESFGTISRGKIRLWGLSAR